MNTQKRVMVVDDEAAVRTSWSRFLAENDYEVTTAEDGDKAISSLTQKPVDVVVADLRMPGKDGLELLDWLHMTQPDTKFILMTGYGDEDVERQARELGAFDYLDKPVSPEVLSAVITAATVERERKARAEEALAETVAEAAEPVEAEPVEQTEKSTARSTAEIIGGLVMGPIIGLAFVMFLPVIGFAAFFKVLTEVFTGKRAVNT
jgi:DNA-binding NtrC family response regulator